MFGGCFNGRDRFLCLCQIGVLILDCDSTTPMTVTDNFKDFISPDNIQELAHWLNSQADYRVLKRLPEPVSYGQVSQAIRVMVIDTETTGTNKDTDAVIEIGAVVVEVDSQTGQLGRVIDVFSGLEDPGFPIPPESTAIHGITDDMVKGKRFDEVHLNRLLENVHLIVAHNSGFDRPFLERRFKQFEQYAWGCTFDQIAWNEEGFGSSKLEFILYKLGFFYDAHRAVTDCYAVLQALNTPLPNSGVMPAQRLIDEANQKQFVIYALNTPYETKDALRNKGFRWDADLRSWKIKVTGKLGGDDIIQWLKANIYQTSNKVLMGFQISVATDRYSDRPISYSTKQV